MTAHDLDFSDSLQWSIVDGGSGTYGSFEVDSTSGAWQFTLDNTLPATQALTEDQQVTESFVVRVTDSQGDFDDQSIVITIDGANDKPIFTHQVDDASGNVSEAGSDDLGG